MTAQLSASEALEKSDWIWQGHTIRHIVTGEGHPVVLIHGFGASAGHWRKNIPALAAAGHQVHALDLLGFGDSDKPEIPYSLEVWELLLKDYWQAFIGKPAIFIGNSIGGLLTLMVLAHHPDIAAAGGVLNCAGGLNHRPEELPLPLRLVMGGFTQLVSSQWLGPLLFRQVRQRSRIRSSLRQVYGNQDAITDDLVEMIYRPACDPGAQKVFASILTAPAGPHPEELLPNIHQPLLVIWGEEDPWTPIKGADPYRRLSQDDQAQPAVTLHTLPKTGHCPHDERPDQVNPLILDWLQQLQRQ